MKNHYQALGVPPSASAAQIRRAYRILARRHHPDVNPGKESKQKFQEILEAYETLSDEKVRKAYDLKFESYQRRNVGKKFEEYQKQQSESFAKMSRGERKKESQFGKVAEPAEEPKEDSIKPPPKPDRSGTVSRVRNWLVDQWFAHVDREEQEDTPPPGERKTRKVSIVEVSVTIEEALKGAQKRIEITEPEGVRQVSIMIPRGVRDGSVIRLRDKQNRGEDLVLVVRLLSHPFVSIKTRGVIVEVPISVSEAMNGAQISVPGLEDEIMVKVPPGTQSGSEVRIKGSGLVGKDSMRGDLHVRFLVKLPEHGEAVGLKEKVSELEKYYESSVRHDLPKTILGR